MFPPEKTLETSQMEPAVVEPYYATVSCERLEVCRRCVCNLNLYHSKEDEAPIALHNHIHSNRIFHIVGPSYRGFLRNGKFFDVESTIQFLATSRVNVAREKN